MQHVVNDAWSHTDSAVVKSTGLSADAQVSIGLGCRLTFSCVNWLLVVACKVLEHLVLQPRWTSGRLKRRPDVKYLACPQRPAVEAVVQGSGERRLADAAYPREAQPPHSIGL